MGLGTRCFLYQSCELAVEWGIGFHFREHMLRRRDTTGGYESDPPGKSVLGEVVANL